jgi:hypothetical protein
MIRSFSGTFVLAGLGFLSAMCVAQPPAGAPAAAPFMTHQLRPNVYWVEGGGGNSTVIGNTGVIVIDAKTTKAGGESSRWVRKAPR